MTTPPNRPCAWAIEPTSLICFTGVPSQFTTGESSNDCTITARQGLALLYLPPAMGFSLQEVFLVCFLEQLLSQLA